MKEERGWLATLHIQKDSPGADKEANWLPAPNGSHYLSCGLLAEGNAAFHSACRRRHLEAAGHREGETITPRS